jgi:hypothetical protein
LQLYPGDLTKAFCINRVYPFALIKENTKIILIEKLAKYLGI